MSKLRNTSISISLAAAVSLAFCVAAPAAVVTVGSPTTTGVTSATVGNPATLLNASVGEAGASLNSPVSGVIIRWHVTGFTGGPWRLRVLTPLGGVGYSGSGTSLPQVPASTATQTFSTNLPIKAGQTIAVDNTIASDKIGLFASPGGSYAFLVPPLADGASGTATGPFPGAEFAFNAEVLPPPTITTVSPAAGPFKGGTSVVIVGTNFTEVKGVSFGAVPAQSYTVNSESVITAVAPASTSLTTASITVTTVAGTATSAQGFAYRGCKVPSLLGAKLKGAKKRVRKAGCKVGKVHKQNGVTAKTGHVIKQSPKPGKLVASGTKVNVKLG